MKSQNIETARMQLDEYRMFWSVEMQGRNESEGTVEYGTKNFQNGFHASMSTRCKLQQSTIGDMNQSLLG